MGQQLMSRAEEEAQCEGTLLSSLCKVNPVGRGALLLLVPMGWRVPGVHVRASSTSSAADLQLLSPILFLLALRTISMLTYSCCHHHLFLPPPLASQ